MTLHLVNSNPTRHTKTTDNTGKLTHNGAENLSMDAPCKKAEKLTLKIGEQLWHK